MILNFYFSVIRLVLEYKSSQIQPDKLSEDNKDSGLLYIEPIIISLD